MSTPPRIAWDQFTVDPRREEYAAMRASDQDRDVALSALGEAFADGRLDREELDERSATVQHAKRLGELVGPLVDLAASAPLAAPGLTSMDDADLQQRAEQSYARARASAFWTFLFPTLICWGIWVATLVGNGGPAFPWPLFVMLGAGSRLFRLLGSGRDTVVAEEKRRLARREQRHEDREQRRLE